MSAAATTPVRLKLQVNTSGAWRNVIDFPRQDDMACAQVLTAAPLLAAAAGSRTTLRIVSTDALPVVFSHWEEGKGWRGALPAPVAARGAP